MRTITGVAFVMIMRDVLVWWLWLCHVI